jgi:hypothetical protein
VIVAIPIAEIIAPPPKLASGEKHINTPFRLIKRKIIQTEHFSSSGNIT